MGALKGCSIEFLSTSQFLRDPTHPRVLIQKCSTQYRPCLQGIPWSEGDTLPPRYSFRDLLVPETSSTISPVPLLTAVVSEQTIKTSLDLTGRS